MKLLKVNDPYSNEYLDLEHEKAELRKTIIEL